MRQLNFSIRQRFNLRGWINRRRSLRQNNFGEGKFFVGGRFNRRLNFNFRRLFNFNLRGNFFDDGQIFSWIIAGNIVQCKRRDAYKNRNQPKFFIGRNFRRRSQRGFQFVNILPTVFGVKLCTFRQNFFQIFAAIFARQFAKSHAQRINITARISLPVAVLFGRRIAFCAE